MEIWLNMDNQKFRLPILPPDFQLTSSNSNEKVKVNAIGMINLLGKKELATITIATFFPATNYSFVAYKDYPKPWDCVKLIEGWKNSGKPLRLIITGTAINMEVGIESFEYGPRDGTKDVYYTLNLSEYVRIKESVIKEDKKELVTTRPAPTKTTGKKTYIVKKGDTLWGIAKKHTGNAMNFKEIAKNNGIKNPNVIKIGQKLII